MGRCVWFDKLLLLLWTGSWVAARRIAPVAGRWVLSGASKRGDKPEMCKSILLLSAGRAGGHWWHLDADGAGFGDILLQRKLPRSIQFSQRRNRTYHKADGPDGQQQQHSAKQQQQQQLTGLETLILLSPSPADLVESNSELRVNWKGWGRKFVLSVVYAFIPPHFQMQKSGLGIVTVHRRWYVTSYGQKGLYLKHRSSVNHRLEVRNNWSMSKRSIT